MDGLVSRLISQPIATFRQLTSKFPAIEMFYLHRRCSPFYSLLGNFALPTSIPSLFTPGCLLTIADPLCYFVSNAVLLQRSFAFLFFFQFFSHDHPFPHCNAYCTYRLVALFSHPKFAFDLSFFPDWSTPFNSLFCFKSFPDIIFYFDYDHS